MHLIDETAITRPAFLIGKVLDILMLDRIEERLRGLDMMNALIDGVTDAVGERGLARVSEAVRVKRGLETRKVDTAVVRPHADIGAVAAGALHDADRGARDLIPSLLARRRHDEIVNLLAPG